MSKILISNMDDAQSVLTKYRPSHIISVLYEAEITFVGPGHKKLYVPMHDTVEPRPNQNPPSISYVKLILDFAKEWDQTAPILVHCGAGRSRSTAAALGVLLVHGVEEPVDKLMEGSPYAHPNSLFVKYLDMMFGLKGELLTEVLQKRNPVQMRRAPLAVIELGKE